MAAMKYKDWTNDQPTTAMATGALENWNGTGQFRTDFGAGNVDRPE